MFGLMLSLVATASASETTVSEVSLLAMMAALLAQALGSCHYGEDLKEPHRRAHMAHGTSQAWNDFPLPNEQRKQNYKLKKKSKKKKMLTGKAWIQKNQARSGGKKLLVTRTQNAVTMYRATGTNLCAPPVQVILQTYESMESLLLDFDTDSCSFAYRPGGSSVYATERGLRALRFSVNVADTQHYTKYFCRRLEKYSGRGFAVGVPGLVPERFSTNITRASYVYILKEIDFYIITPSA